jgi:5,10-methenyltetrahydrofolate synthetase
VDKRPLKSELRSLLLATRHAVTAAQRAQSDAAISNRVLALHRAEPLRTLGVYWPIRSEPDLQNLYAELSAQGVSLALPFVLSKYQPLRFAAWKPGDPLEKDAMGIAVPANEKRFLLPEALLIPCVGFNAAAVRLGYGGGYYDRTLAVSPRPTAIGIAYECCKADFVSEPHDIPLDFVITEKGIIRLA